MMSSTRITRDRIPPAIPPPRAMEIWSELPALPISELVFKSPVGLPRVPSDPLAMVGVVMVDARRSSAVSYICAAGQNKGAMPESDAAPDPDPSLTNLETD